MYRKLQNIYIKYQNIYKKENSFSFRSSWFDFSEKKSAVINLQYMHNMRSHVLWRRENVLAAQSMKWYGQFGWQQERLFGLNKKKCWMFARAKKAWPLLLRRIYKLVQQFHKVSILQYLMPGKKPPTFILTTCKLLNPCKHVCSTFLALQTQHQEEFFFLCISAGVLRLLQGSFNTVTVYQFCLAQGKMKAKQSVLPILSKGLVV